MKLKTALEIACRLWFVAVLLAPVVAVAGEPEPETPLPDQWMLRVGGYHVRDANTFLRLDANGVPLGTSIDFDKNLGGETENTVVRIDGRYRFNDAHAIGAAWYSLNFNGTRDIDRDIEWGDQTYPINTRLDSKIGFDIYKLNYQYSLFHNDEVELGASIGFHVMRASISLAASGIGQSKSESVTAPLPVWGLFAGYNFTPKLRGFYNYQSFSINYDDKVKGGLQDFLIGLEYRLFRNLAVGVAYNRFAANLEIKKVDSTVTIDTSWNGGMLYGSLYF